jgi:glycerophosphoryl diester phosphodiesterase
VTAGTRALTCGFALAAPVDGLPNLLAVPRAPAIGDRAPGPAVLAHRGARTVAPENTLEAFRIALEQHADGVELDVHRTIDDGLVVHHDADAAGLGVLAAVSRDAIRAARPDIPTLAEVLDACVGSLVNIEIKNLPGDADYDDTDRAAELVVELLAARSRRDDVIVSSFNLVTVNRVRRLDEHIPTAFLVMLGIDPFDALRLCADHGHAALHPFAGMLNGDDGPAIVERADELGLAVNVWTVNEETEMRRLAVAGVDGIITDVPDVARRVISAMSA